MFALNIHHIREKLNYTLWIFLFFWTRLSKISFIITMHCYPIFYFISGKSVIILDESPKVWKWIETEWNKLFGSWIYRNMTLFTWMFNVFIFLTSLTVRIRQIPYYCRLLPDDVTVHVLDLVMWQGNTWPQVFALDVVKCIDDLEDTPDLAKTHVPFSLISPPVCQDKDRVQNV